MLTTMDFRDDAEVHTTRMTMSQMDVTDMLRLYAPRAGQFHPQGGSTRFRLAPRTYDAPPCGPSVRVVSQTKSRKIPKTITALLRAQIQHHLRGGHG